MNPSGWEEMEKLLIWAELLSDTYEQSQSVSCLNRDCSRRYTLLTCQIVTMTTQVICQFQLQVFTLILLNLTFS